MGAIRNVKISQWIEIAEFLCRNSPQSAMCPECGKASLRVRDVEYGPGASRGTERYLVCSSCGAFNAVNVRRAGRKVSD